MTFKTCGVDKSPLTVVDAQSNEHRHHKMYEPSSVGRRFTSVRTAFRFADITIKIAEAGSDHEVFARTIHIVRSDLNEVERLVNSILVRRNLTRTPAKYPWIQGAIANTKGVLDQIGKWVEQARGEQQPADAPQFDAKVRWAFSDHEKLIDRKLQLATCHRQLSTVLHYLTSLEADLTTVEWSQSGTNSFYDDILMKHKKKVIELSNTKAIGDQCMFSCARVFV